jgi:NTE family protein
VRSGRSNTAILPVQTLVAFGAFLNAVASPYDTNPLNINPLRRALVQTVDFESGVRSGRSNTAILPVQTLVAEM